MELGQYLIKTRQTASAFAAKIDRSVSTVTRAIRGEVIPDYSTMRLIFKESGGKVKPNDFYDLGT